MEKKKLQNISIIALIISMLPFATLIPVFLQIVLPDGLRTVWSGVNIACVITGLCLSIICVKNNESRSLINIISTIISVLLLLLVSGIIFSCTACSRLDFFADNLKSGAKQLNNDVAIGKSNALITPYQSFSFGMEKLINLREVLF